jgi:5-methylcytosine-specific restriction endonuclease McrA
MVMVLNKLNLRCAGGNYKTIKKYIELYNIDISHFETDDERYSRLIKYNTNNKIPLEDILVINSTYSRTNLKPRLISENILEYKCIECGNTGEWNGKPITLQLDHVNGVYNDNRVENLRFLCPNCHSQTETYAGKKNKVDIKIEKVHTTPPQQKEMSLKRRKVCRPNYEKLMEEINELGYTGTGRKYGVSDNAIRKWKKFYEK